MKGQPIKMKDIFTNHISYREPSSRIYKENTYGSTITQPGLKNQYEYEYEMNINMKI